MTSDPSDGRAPASVGSIAPVAVLIALVAGILIGAVVTAAFLPLLPSNSHHKASSPSPTPVATGVPDGCGNYRLAGVIASDVDAAIGKYGGPGTHAGQTRVVSVCLTRVYPFQPHVENPPPLFNVWIRFLLEPNPVSPTVQVGGARTDCFLILQALYSRNFPLRLVGLVGLYQLPNATHPDVLLRAGSNPHIESALAPWKSAVHTRSPVVWAYLRPHWISPRFGKYTP